MTLCSFAPVPHPDGSFQLSSFFSFVSEMFSHSACISAWHVNPNSVGLHCTTADLLVPFDMLNV